MNLYLGTSDSKGSEIHVVVYEEDSSGNINEIGELDTGGRITSDAVLPSPRSQPLVLAEAFLKFSPPGFRPIPESRIEFFKQEFLESIKDLGEQSQWWFDASRVANYGQERAALNHWVRPPILGLMPSRFAQRSPFGTVSIDKGMSGYAISTSFERSGGPAVLRTAREAAAAVLDMFPFVTRELEALTPPLAKYLEETVRFGVHALSTEKISSWARMQLRGMDNDMSPSPPTRYEIVEPSINRGQGR